MFSGIIEFQNQEKSPFTNLTIQNIFETQFKIKANFDRSFCSQNSNLVLFVAEDGDVICVMIETQLIPTSHIDTLQIRVDNGIGKGQ